MLMKSNTLTSSLWGKKHIPKYLWKHLSNRKNMHRKNPFWVGTLGCSPVSQLATNLPSKLNMSKICSPLSINLASGFRFASNHSIGQGGHQTRNRQSRCQPYWRKSTHTVTNTIPTFRPFSRRSDALLQANFKVAFDILSVLYVDASFGTVFQLTNVKADHANVRAVFQQLDSTGFSAATVLP